MAIQKHIQVKNGAEKFSISFKVDINSEDHFKTTLSKSVVDQLLSRNIQLKTNGRSNGRLGYFSSPTMSGLLLQIEEKASEYISRELIEETLVIRYSIKSCCSFGLDVSGNIIPSLGFLGDDTPDLETGWLGGTQDSHAAKPEPTGVMFYVKPYHKRAYKYRSGREFVEYERLSPFGGHAKDVKKDYYLHYLAGIVSTRPVGELRELPYTQKRGKFFVDLFKKLCVLTYAMTKIDEVEAMDTMIETGGNLLLT